MPAAARWIPLFMVLQTFGATAHKDYIVRATAVAQTSPAQIVLSWTSDSSDSFPQFETYTIYRKSRDATSWGSSIASLDHTATGYTDSTVSVGDAYEYRIDRLTLSGSGDADGLTHAYVYAGVEAPLVESRGTVILIIDKTMTNSLSSELTRLERDLAGDGWTVSRHDVDRMSVEPSDTSSSNWAARISEINSLKSLISTDYTADSANVKAVFLFGHVPVPYSGDSNPDGHSNHKGAWPADVYYGDMSGTWTDTTVNRQTASDQRNYNVPGDGKFDQSTLPNDANVALEVGRVDLANLSSFSSSETELLRQYLDKDHNFRHLLLTVERRGLIDDNFAAGSGDDRPYAAIGWRAFAPLFGTGAGKTDSITPGTWVSTLGSESYLFGYGDGAGTFSSASGVITTSQAANNTTKIVFTMLWGSYFGDWDSSDNLLRAQLASPTYPLTSVWAGTPWWVFHHMALGEPIGLDVRLSQTSSDAVYHNDGPVQAAWAALMGDPTLRLHPVGTPSHLTVSKSGSGGTDFSWNAPSGETVSGYNIYHASTAEGPFTRLNGSLIGSGTTTYSDASAPSGAYMVRTVKLETSGSGTYYNASQGAFAPVPGTDTTERDASSGVKLAVSQVLSNDIDPYGDTLTVTGVASSGSGASVTLSNGWIYYAPNGLEAADTFTYTVTNSGGAASVGTVNVNLRSDTAQTLNISTAAASGGGIDITVNGIPSRSYTVQYSDSLSPASWQVLGTVTVNSVGVGSITDVNGSAMRYYRTVYP